MISPVDLGVYRGPRPQSGDMSVIKAQFASVISLEGIEEDKKEIVELAPVQVTSFPISPIEIYIRGISQDRLAEILQSIMSSRKPLLVHCQHGQDRTGLVIAAYRVDTCAWTKERAMAEALSFGYRKWLNFGLNMTWQHLE